jgi:hypothetical protein
MRPLLTFDLQDWFRLLRDPDRKELERMMKVGQQVAWPTVSPVLNLSTEFDMAEM